MTDKDTIEDFKKKHIENYRMAIIELIKNNTNVLIEDDITSLLCKPPLDSMDTLKNNFLDLAKKNSIILDDEKLNDILENFRKSLCKWITCLKKDRIVFLSDIVLNYKLINDMDIIKINKKDFINVNKKLKKKIKIEVSSQLEKKIVNNVNSLFTNNVTVEVKDVVLNDITKFLNGKYQKQLFDNIDFKVLVKDTTLINLVKEQGERYIFTKKNSYIFNEK